MTLGLKTKNCKSYKYSVTALFVGMCKIFSSNNQFVNFTVQVCNNLYLPVKSNKTHCNLQCKINVHHKNNLQQCSFTIYKNNINQKPCTCSHNAINVYSERLLSQHSVSIQWRQVRNNIKTTRPRSLYNFKCSVLWIWKLQIERMSNITRERKENSNEINLFRVYETTQTIFVGQFGRQDNIHLTRIPPRTSSSPQNYTYTGVE